MNFNLLNVLIIINLLDIMTALTNQKSRSKIKYTVSDVCEKLWAKNMKSLEQSLAALFHSSGERKLG